MNENQRRIADLVVDVHNFYKQEMTQFAGTVWGTALFGRDCQVVQQAFLKFMLDPDAGRFMPKPADILRLLKEADAAGSTANQ